MSRFAYVNGRYLPFKDATISIDDRGLQFGDSIYEVWPLKDGKLLDKLGHFQRLRRSLKELKIEFDFSQSSLEQIIAQLISVNRTRNGLVYLQITRGTAIRDHQFPAHSVANLIITLRPKDFALMDARAAKGINIKTIRDFRWGRVDIKTTNLLANVLAKQDAIENGFDDAWFFDDKGFITEGSAQNAWIVTKDGNLQTRNLGNDILAGITRAKVFELAKIHELNVVEKPFSIEEAKNAREAFITSAGNFVTAVISIDGAPIGNGNTGIIASQLRKSYIEQQ